MTLILEKYGSMSIKVPLKGAILKENGSKWIPVALWIFNGASSAMRHIRTFSGYKCSIALNERERYYLTDASLSLIEQREAVGLKGGRLQLYGNYQLLSKAVLAKKEENSLSEKREFLAKVIGSLPIPYKKEWSEDLLEEFSGVLEKCTIIGDTPYKEASILNISFGDNIYVTKQKIDAILTRAHGRYLFKKKFKRVPKIEALLYLKDVEGFNFKAWQKVLKDLEANPENFKQKVHDAFNIDERKFVHFFEVFGEATYEILEFFKEKDMSFMYVSSLENAALEAKKMKASKKQLFEKNIKRLKETVEALEEERKRTWIPFSTLLGAVMMNVYKVDFSKSPKQLLKAFMEVSYKNIHPLAKSAGLSKKAASLMLHEVSYKKYETMFVDVYEKITVSPKQYPTLKGKIEGTDYTWESMDFSDPNAWFVGLETNCCQHLESAGATCLVYGANNPETSGIFRVMKKGRTVAQSWFWIHDGTFVFDNIEVLRREMRDSVFQAYLDFAKEIVKRKYFGISKITIGLGYNDAGKYIDSLPADQNPTMIPSSGTYSDARRQVVLWDSLYGWHYKTEYTEQEEAA